MRVHAQTFALFKHMRLRFPHKTWMLMSAFAVANLDMDILRTPCVLGHLNPLSNVVIALVANRRQWGHEHS